MEYDPRYSTGTIGLCVIGSSILTVLTLNYFEISGSSFVAFVIFFAYGAFTWFLVEWGLDLVARIFTSLLK